MPRGKKEEHVPAEFAEEAKALAQKTEQAGSNYANAKFPKGFAHPYTFTDKNGKEWQKAIINIPQGTKANGIDLSGYSVDIFLNDRQKGQIASGEGITVGFKADEKVELFKGEGADRSTIPVEPFQLAKAIKTQRSEFAAAKAQEREVKQAEKGKPSLSGKTEKTTEAKEGLSGKEPPAQPAPQR